MSRILVVLLAVLGVLLVAGLLYVAIFDLPAPSKPVERVIPNERFAR
jgi:hypothetical protein